MQQVSIILSYACIYDHTQTCFHKANIRLNSEELSMADVLDTLRDTLLDMNTNNVQNDMNTTTTTSNNNNLDENQVVNQVDIEKELNAKYKQVLTDWCAMLSTIISSD